MTQQIWDVETDVIVVGAGAAGFAAAITAARTGASVLLLEKAGMPGGTTSKSGGTIWVPNNSFMRAAGFEDSRDDALRYISSVFPR
ncbi:FAD-dependent oxidoreductase [Cryobacterium aureum]|uniref:FAD-dependent oxidoreductase n=1 Tax=Cryobacterium aureum TaxID=995037 RepID=UPI000CF46005|nr:FAD-dependent oxidoreductase [Cryobacterium aureum]